MFIIKTKEYLEKLGVSCDITDTPVGVDFNNYDIVHLTDLTAVIDIVFYLKHFLFGNRSNFFEINMLFSKYLFN